MKLFKSFFLILIFVTMLSNPPLVAEATKFGIQVWWDSVLPALLPFFITAELLIALGIMNCLSVWLEPIMRPIFRLPGAAALAIVMGFVSGSPTGASITAGLREKGLCTKNEGERLVSFTNNASPLYILVAVAIGILQSPQIGFFLFLSHYPVNLLFGILLRFTGQRSPTAAPKASLLYTLNEGLKAIKNCPTPPLGSLLSNCVKKSLINVGVVGGFIVIFSLLSAILEELQIIHWMSVLLLPVCKIFEIDPGLSQSMASGFWEMTIGIAKMSQTEADLLSKTLAAAIMLAWNGVSIQAQVGAMLQHTDLKLNCYLLLRVLHTFIAPAILLLAAPWITSSTSTINSPGLLYISPILFLLFGLLALAGLSFLGLLLCKISFAKSY